MNGEGQFNVMTVMYFFVALALLYALLPTIITTSTSASSNATNMLNNTSSGIIEGVNATWQGSMTAFAISLFPLFVIVVFIGVILVYAHPRW